MGFHSTLMLYRPGKPPIVIGRSLSVFLQRLLELGISDVNRSGGTLAIKFGEAIDQDERPAWWIASTSVENIGIIEDIEWDVEQFSVPITETMAILSKSDKPIYRAHIGLGAAADETIKLLRRSGSAQNDEDYVPDSWSFEIGPIKSGRDGEFVVGWMAIGIGGNGYLYPWTLRELVQRAEQLPEIVKLMRLCRESWPVDAELQNMEVQQGREQMGPYWPYEKLDKPWDWYWGLQGVL